MIYFYGGAFNPMTKAHINIIKNILDNMKDEDLMIIAITDHDYKNYDYDYNTRLHIVLKNLKYSGFNDTLGGRIQLIKQDRRTWKFLNEVLNIKNNLTLVVGEDEWNDLNEWKWNYSKELLNTYKFKVIPRTDDISSTKVRELIKNNVDFNELQKYITKETYNILKGF
jgi:nicotinate-nucleotide adenylyltransferase